MIRSLILALAATSIAAPSASAAFRITVAPSVGPNIFGSPSYGTYRDNALSALASGSPTAGTPGTPEFYSQVPNGGTILATDIVVTDFPSWLGRANPGTAFGPAFAAEVGTRLYFGLTIFGDTPGERFSISQLSFEGTTTDPNRLLDFSFAAGEYEYSEDYVGVILNPNGTVNRLVTSGSNTEVDALIGRGSSNGFEILSSFPGATNQEKIDHAMAGIGDFRFTGTYRLGGASGSATVNIAAVPAPPSVVLGVVGVGMAALPRLARRRRAA